MASKTRGGRIRQYSTTMDGGSADDCQQQLRLSDQHRRWRCAVAAELKWLCRNALVLLTILVSLCAFPALAASVAFESIARPLPPEYRIEADGSVALRLCFNWSCAARQRVTFTAAQMDQVVRQMQLCPSGDLHERLQRVRIGIWQMEQLAQKHQPLLANDKGINHHDQDRAGRMDCIDNASNTTTYLKVLRDLGWLPGWSIAEPKVRDQFWFSVHWSAAIVDARSTRPSPAPWVVDSWFRGNGNLPFVMPLADWERGKIPWEQPFAVSNPYPQYIHQLCTK